MGTTLAEGGRELRLKVLEAVQERIRSLYADTAEIMHHEEGGQRPDVLTAVMTRFGRHQDACLGEYLFREIPGDPEGGQYFIAFISLRSDFSVKQVPELAFAVSVLNFYIETGCFAMNQPTNLLVYRNTRTFQGDVAKETLIRECTLLMEETYDIAAKYCTPVLALADGSINIQEFLEMLQEGWS